jgi:hypothetical protein
MGLLLTNRDVVRAQECLKYIEDVCRKELPTMQAIKQDGHLIGIVAMTVAIKKILDNSSVVAKPRKLDIDQKIRKQYGS